jgi:hypothetical protein
MPFLTDPADIIYCGCEESGDKIKNTLNFQRYLKCSALVETSVIQ